MTITMPWDSKLEIGHQRIDGEHRTLHDLVRGFAREAEEGASPERLVRRLEEVYKFADFHFTSEENAMIDGGFPWIDEHRKSHRHLLAQLRDMINAFGGDARQVETIASTLFQWFALHTAQEDKWLAGYLTP